MDMQFDLRTGRMLGRSPAAAPKFRTQWRLPIRDRKAHELAEWRSRVIFDVDGLKLAHVAALECVRAICRGIAFRYSRLQIMQSGLKARTIVNLTNTFVLSIFAQIASGLSGSFPASSRWPWNR